MASMLDLGLFESFSAIFPFILVFAIVYSLLQKYQVISDNHSINAIIGFIAGFLVMLSQKVLMVIQFVTPWFVLLFFFGIMMLITLKLFGTTDEDIRKAMLGGATGTDKSIPYWIIFLSSLILVVGIAAVYGESLLPLAGATGSSDVEFQKNAWSAFFHPKVVGLIFVSLIGAMTIKLLSGDESHRKGK